MWFFSYLILNNIRKAPNIAIETILPNPSLTQCITPHTIILVLIRIIKKKKYHKSYNFILISIHIRESYTCIYIQSLVMAFCYTFPLPNCKTKQKYYTITMFLKLIVVWWRLYINKDVSFGMLIFLHNL